MAKNILVKFEMTIGDYEHSDQYIFDKEMTEYSGLEPYEFKLLDLIRKRTIASQMAAQVFDVYTVTIKLSNKIAI